MPLNQPDEDNIVQLVPTGKIRCYITGKLRQDRPEEHVRQRWARSLVEEYRYRKDDIELEFKIKMGIKTKKADIVVFKEGNPHKQENIFIIVEAKREDILPRGREEGVDQLKSYMAASSQCRYGLWVGSERQGFEKDPDGSIIEGLADIPTWGALEPRVPTFSDLSPAVELKTVFRRCHNYIYVNQGLQKAEAFHEMLKLIFCKVYDETESAGDLRFFIRSEERRSEAGQRRVMTERIAPLFEAVKHRYPYIFKPNEEIQLTRRVLSYIVSELQRISSCFRTQTDVMGDAYEELVGANLRGDRGEYFTPRNVCDMAVQMVASLYPTRRISDLKILDPCCGTGGFLVSYINYTRQIVTGQERGKGGSEEEMRQRAGARIKDLCSQNLFGLDINPFLVRTCQMNLVMHGDGSANVFQADTLLSPGEWDDTEAAKKSGHGKFDVVVTNPPFGGRAIVDDPHVLDKYDLSSYETPNKRSSMPAEQLFVEAALKFLKPGGIVAIVLPDSILNNPGLLFIRSWFLKHARIIGTIDLPKETFATSGGVPNPSVIVAKKYTTNEMRLFEANALEYEIFMAIPKTSGIDKRGNPVYLRTPEGFDLFDENLERVVDDEIRLVPPEFAGWVREMGYAGT